MYYVVSFPHNFQIALKIFELQTKKARVEFFSFAKIVLFGGIAASGTGAGH